MSEKNYHGQEGGKVEEYLKDNAGLMPAGKQVLSDYQMT